jgi:hypothetical protein
MFSRPSGSANRPATIALCLMTACVAVAVLCAATAHAGQFKMVMCAADSGTPGFSTETNTINSTHPSGIFDFGNHCGGQGGDPPGDAAFLRIAEHEASGSAGNGAYGRFVFATPWYVHFKAAGGYTRQPSAFNEGWRSRFWGLDFANNAPIFINQGAGVPTSGVDRPSSNTFGAHLWPYTSFLDFHHFYFELLCVRPAGCDRANYNATDANGFVLILNDDEDSKVSLTGPAQLISGAWVRGTQAVAWNASDNGSGLRFERLGVDGTERYTVDHQALGECNIGASPANGEFARTYQPCQTGGPYGRGWALDTASLADGAHALQVCTWDYGQYRGLNGTGGATCDSRTIHTDNIAPGAPVGLEVTSVNPNRYLPNFGTKWQLPPDSGSPLASIHYNVVDSKGEVIVPAHTVAASSPTALPTIEGPAKAGNYRLRVWLEDSVGLTGPAASVPVPRDTTPPAAPQGLHVLGTTAHRVPEFDVQWSNGADAGSPIDTAHYQLIDRSGEVVAPTKAIIGDDIKEIDDIATPSQEGDYTVRVWLTDAEGNVGAPASVAVPRDTTPPAAPQDLSVTAPASSRASQGYDLRWRDIVDEGSPINAAHYKVLDASGGVVVPATKVAGEGISQIADLETPHGAGTYTLLLWLSDAEGNVGAPVRAPLAYDCVRSEVRGGTELSAGLGDAGRSDQLIPQGEGSTLAGRLRGPGGAVSGASVCVFSSVITDTAREFLGIAMTGSDGGYRFAIPPGPSRAISVIYRPDQREVRADATLYTRVRPTLQASGPVQNKALARFYGRIPGPHNDRVVVVLQVKQGHGWRVFRRYRTREGGRYQLIYRFGRTSAPATYLMRAQVRRQGGYPYLPGNSRLLHLRVMP